MQAK